MDPAPALHGQREGRNERPPRRSDGEETYRRILEAAMRVFEREVLNPGLDAPDGPIHDKVLEGKRGWLRLLEDLTVTARDQGELDPDTDPGQLAFELYAALELANFLSTLFRDPWAVDRGRRAVQAALARWR